MYSDYSLTPLDRSGILEGNGEFQVLFMQVKDWKRV
jgi:hypothetical protein